MTRAPSAAAPFPYKFKSRALSVSRITGRGRCARADFLRHEEQLAPIGVVVEPEHLTRGSVVHAGLAAALVRLPGEPDPGEVTAACIAEAVSRGLGATDPRVAGWARVALRAARALPPGDWRAVRMPVSRSVGPVAGRDGSGRGEGAGSADGLTTRRTGDDAACQSGGSADEAPPGMVLWMTDNGVAWGLQPGRDIDRLGEVADTSCSDHATRTWSLARREAWAWHDANPQLVEVRLGVPMPDATKHGDGGAGWLLSIKPDGVLENLRTGRRWQWDHKTKSASTMSRVGPWTELHLQSLLYVYGLRTLGVDVTGAVLYAVLAEHPKVPELRKDGHLKEIMYATDLPTALEVIARSEDPDPESPRHAKLLASIAERRWQDTQEVMFDDAELELAWSFAVDARDEYVAAVGRAADKARELRLPVWRAMHPTGRGVECERCDYQQWCSEEFAGRDAESLIGSLYRRGADKYVAEVALTSGRGDTHWAPAGDFDGIEKRRSAP